jgi:tight adherence protein C
MIEILLFACFIGCIVSITFAVFHRKVSPSAEETGISEEEKVKKRKSFKEIIDILLNKLAGAVSKVDFPLLASLREDVAHKLNKARLSAMYSPDKFLALCVVSGTGVSVVLSVLLGVNLLYFLIFFALGMFLPFLWLQDKLNKREKEIINTLPDILDLLTICIEAGAELTTAINKILEKSLFPKNALLVELEILQSELQVGVGRIDAINNLIKRVDNEVVTNVMKNIIQAIQSGMSLAPILRSQAEQMRTVRFQAAERRAHEAPVKILFPLVLFIFPSVFIIIFGPIILNFFRKGF